MFGRFLARLGISARLIAVLAIGFTYQASISGVSLIHLKESLLQQRTIEVKHLLETAFSTVVFYHAQAAEGRMSVAAARQAAAAALRAMRYDGNNYFFIWTLDSVSVVNGGHPEWEGNKFEPRRRAQSSVRPPRRCCAGRAGRAGAGT